MKSTKLFVGSGLALAVGAVVLGASLTASAASSGGGPSAGGSAMSVTASGDGVVVCSIDVADLTMLPVGEGVQVVAAAPATDVAISPNSGVITGAATLVSGELSAEPVPIGANQPVEGQVFSVSIDANGELNIDDSNGTIRAGTGFECAPMLAAATTAATVTEDTALPAEK